MHQYQKNMSMQKPGVFENSEPFLKQLESHSHSPVKTTQPLANSSINMSRLLLQGEFMNLKYGDPVLIDPPTPKKLPLSSGLQRKLPRSLSLERPVHKRKERADLSFKINNDNHIGVNSQIVMPQNMSIANEKKSINTSQEETEDKSFSKRCIQLNNPSNSKVLLSDLAIGSRSELSFNSQLLKFKTAPVFEEFASANNQSIERRGNPARLLLPSLITQLCSPFMMDHRNQLSHLRSKFIEDYRTKRQTEEYLFYTGKGTPLRKRNSSNLVNKSQNSVSGLLAREQESNSPERNTSKLPALRLTIQRSNSPLERLFTPTKNTSEVLSSQKNKKILRKVQLDSNIKPFDQVSGYFMKKSDIVGHSKEIDVEPKPKLTFMEMVREKIQKKFHSSKSPLSKDYPPLNGYLLEDNEPQNSDEALKKVNPDEIGSYRTRKNKFGLKTVFSSRKEPGCEQQIVANIVKKQPSYESHPLFEETEQNIKEFEKMNAEIIDNRVHWPGRRFELKHLYKRIRELLLNLVFLKISSREFYSGKIFSTSPFEKPESETFIQAAKLGDIKKIKQLLSKNKYLVYDFDNAHLTALHWAVKRGHEKVAKCLIQYRADVNAKDIIHRPPLYFAISHNQLQIMKILLIARANPWSDNEINYNALVEGKPHARQILSECRKLHLLLKTFPRSVRASMWEKRCKSALFQGEDQLI